ncbi:MAG: T9SS type A sorting domain-containing protein [Ignavibacteria bacterium]|nr:T9SS type A sorting domain-containing protein [Ignavibacteria bacterium]
MKAHLDAVWIPLQESSTKLFTSIRTITATIAVSSFALALLLAPQLNAQNTLSPATPKTETKVKIITIKDGKTEVVETVGNENSLNNPEIAKLLKDNNINLEDLKSKCGNINVRVHKVINGKNINENITINSADCKEKMKNCQAKCMVVRRCGDSAAKSNCKIMMSNEGMNVGQQMMVITTNSTTNTGTNLKTESSTNEDVTIEATPQNMQVITIDEDTEINNGDTKQVQVWVNKTDASEDSEMLNHLGTNGANTTKFIIQRGDGKNKVIVISNRQITTTSPEKNTPEGSPKIQEMPSMNLNVNGLQLAPNPTNGQFNLSFSLQDTGNTDISIVDLAGREIYGANLPNFSGDFNQKIDISDKARGEYLLKISQNGKSATAAIVLE